METRKVSVLERQTPNLDWSDHLGGSLFDSIDSDSIFVAGDGCRVKFNSSVVIRSERIVKIAPR